MAILDVVAALIVLAILAIARYVWVNRKRTVKEVDSVVERIPLSKTGERQGKAFAGEMKWRDQ